MIDRTSPALQVEHVGVQYGMRTALHNINLTAHAGEFVAITGPNGAGKSTLLRAILGLQPTTTGSIALHGDSIRSLPIRERARRMAWVPQNESPQESVSLLDYVLFGRHAHLPRFGGETEVDRGRARDALQRVGLWDRRDTGILEVSGGERQRVLLARALAQETPVLLLDEPTAQLDISHQLELLENVRSMSHETQRLVLAAMHDLNLAARYADRIIVLAHGRLREEGPPSSVLSPGLLREVWGVVAEMRTDVRSGHPYLIPVLLPADLEPSPTLRTSRGTVHVVGGGGAATAILRALHEEGYHVTAGALPLFDTDTETAVELGLTIATEIPFAPLGPEVRAKNRRLLGLASAIVLAPFAIGPGNLGNLEDVLPFAFDRPVFFLESATFPRRDFTSGAAPALRKQILAAGARDVATLSELQSQLRRAVPPELGPTAGGARAAT